MQTGYTRFSSENDMDLPPYPEAPNTPLFHVPIGAATSDLTNEIDFVAVTHQVVISEIETQLAANGFAAVMVVISI